MQRRHGVFAWITLCMLVLGCAAMAAAQVNTAALSGTVSDPQGLGVKGAKLTLTNAATGLERTAVADDGGGESHPAQLGKRMLDKRTPLKFDEGFIPTHPSASAASENEGVHRLTSSKNSMIDSMPR